MLGAGDIKLMAVCVGFLGLCDGVFVIFLGLGLGAFRAAFVLVKEEILWERLNRLGQFVIQSGLNGKLTEYPGRREAGSLLKLGPYLFFGYCLFMLMGRIL